MDVEVYYRGRRALGAENGSSYQRLDAFELRVLARPAPPVDVSILQATVDNLPTDIDMILEARVPESEALSAEPAEDTVLAALFATSEIP